MNPVCKIILASIAAVLAVGHIASAQVAYSLVPIYPPEGSGAYSLGGLGINNSGEVVGEYSRYAGVPGYNQIRSIIYSDSAGTIEAWAEAGRC